MVLFETTIPAKSKGIKYQKKPLQKGTVLLAFTVAGGIAWIILKYFVFG